MVVPCTSLGDEVKGRELGGGRREVGVPSTSLSDEVKCRELGGGRGEVGVL